MTHTFLRLFNRKAISYFQKVMPLAFTFLLGITSALAQIDLQITEIFSGQSGTKLTADWIEIKNEGSTAWTSGVDADLYYDDESSDFADASIISGITDIQPGEYVIVMISDDPLDIVNFKSIWAPVANIKELKVGVTDGKGLGGGGDAATLWMGDPETTTFVDYESYPDTELNDGQSFDLELAAFSSDGNASLAITTLAMGGDASNVPNVASPGNKGAVVIDINEPQIKVDITSSVRLKLNEENASFVAASMGDPTDPASTDGITFVLSDNDTPLEDLTVTATSDNQAVVKDEDIKWTKNAGILTVKINPTAVGYTTIILTVSDTDAKSNIYGIAYAVSAASNSPLTSRYHAGSSDGSTAIVTGEDYMWVADDENQVLRLFNRNNSGSALKEINMNADLGIDGEIDLEGSYRNGNTIYWMGSHTETDRAFLFSVTESGSGLTSELTYEGKYAGLRNDLIDWDNNNVHGKGAAYYNLANSLEIEALSIDPNNSGGALIGLRGPVIEGKAVLIPVINFEALTTTSTTATFGTPIEMDLGKRSFRSLECNENGCIIIGGPVGNINDFKLYTWSGDPLDAPELRANNLMDLNPQGSYEGIVGLPSTSFTGANGVGAEIQLLIDMGTYNFYNDGSEAKDLPSSEWKKTKSERMTLGAVEIPPVALEGDIVITEIMNNPSAVGDDVGEWFELYNATSVDIDLNGWSISDNGTNAHTIDNGGSLVIASKSYLVLGVNADVSTNGGVTVAYEYASGFALGNSDDELILKASDGNTIDSVAWDNGSTFPDPNGASMSLQNPNFDNNLGANWCEAATTTYGDGDFGTPGLANDCPVAPSADLQITEIWMGNAVGDNLTADWIEITNFGDVAWISGSSENLYYDDESQAPAEADLINGISDIQPGESVIVIISEEADVAIFKNIWSSDYNLEGVEVGFANGAGLGQGGDGATLFLGEPAVETIVDFETFPAGATGGASYDVVLAAFSQIGVGTEQLGSNVAIATTANNGSEPAVGSPGNKGALITPAFDLHITEIYSGQSGTKLTADWFEIVNKGTAPWVSGVSVDLYYDDESADATKALLIEGLTEIAPGQSAIVLITDNAEADVATFKTVWAEVIDMDGLQIGYMDGAGLGSGGDAVVLWVGNPNTTTPVDVAEYPNTEANDGQTYDVELAAFSEVGNANNAVQTIALGGDATDVPNIGSPGNGLAMPSFAGMMISEVFSGQSGTKLTADWIEIKNASSMDWISGVSPDLYYDDESASADDATLIEGISSLSTGGYAIVVIGNEADAAEFVTVWSPVVDLNGVEVGYTDGAGLGGGGDAIALWVGNPQVYKQSYFAEYPDTENNDGQTYDFELNVFSEVGNSNFAVATLAMGGAGANVANIGSPGNIEEVPTAVINFNTVSAISVFPNPSNGVYNIQMNNGSVLSSAKVFDVTGQLLLTKNFKNNNYRLDLTELQGAVFMIQLETETGIEIIRVSKQ